MIVYNDEKEEHRLVCSLEDLWNLNWVDAKKLFETYQHEDFSGWRLPNKVELHSIYTHLHKNDLGNFSNKRYWSSTNVDNQEAWHLKR